MVSTDKTKILLDAGVKLGEVVEYPKIDDRTLREIDGIFVSHAHLDHSGYLPHIYTAGYRGNVFASKPTIELINVLISDYMRLSNPENVSKEGLSKLAKGFKIFEFRKELKFRDLKIQQMFSGHILGSSMIKITDGNNSLIYSGDINLAKTRLFDGAETRDLQAKNLIIESTYGARKDVFPKEGVIVPKMLKSIKDTINLGGKVIIPSFAVGRAQEILLLLDDYMNSGVIPKVPIYVDGMINKALRIHRHNVIYCRKELQSRILMSDYDPFKSPNFVPVETKGTRSKVVNDDDSSIIVTTSGMLTGGPIIYYLSKLAGNSTHKLMIVGYQAAGTPGRLLQEGVRELRFENKRVEIKLNVETYHLSAHADRPQLETFVKKTAGLEDLFIVHGEKSKSEEFREDISKKINAVVPKPEDEYKI